MSKAMWFGVATGLALASTARAGDGRTGELAPTWEHETAGEVGRAGAAPIGGAHADRTATDLTVEQRRDTAVPVQSTDVRTSFDEPPRLERAFLRH